MRRDEGEAVAGAAAVGARFSHFRAPVVRRDDLAPGTVRLVFEAPGLVVAKPGQFVNLLCRDETSLDPLVRRPFSLAGVDRARGLASVVIKSVGRGSAWLAARQAGDVLDVLGPLGRGFACPTSGQAPTGPVLLVGGGTGTAPLLFLAQELAAGGYGPVVAVTGFRSRRDVVLADEFSSLGAEVMVATEDGSAGRQGTASQVAEAVWDEASAIFACGPWGMLRALERLRRAKPRPLQVAVETMMGCGAGVCLSCVVPWRRREGYRVTGWARACVEGPVFDAEELVWERCPGAGE